MGKCCRQVWLIIWLFLAGPALAAGACAPDTVKVRGEWGRAQFDVEVADDAESRATGLMHRESLPRWSGMLFVYPEPRRVGFWMKNTLIPLDMIFVDATGTVTFVHTNAQPHDESPVIGPDDTRAVLEVNGGVSARLGIAPGSEIRHPAFASGIAAWPC